MEREARTALDEGYEVDVVAMRRLGERATEIVDGARVYRLPISHRRGAGAGGILREYLGFTALACVRVALLAWRRRHTVVQIHNPPDFLVLTALFPKLLGARVVLDVHDLSPDMFAMRYQGRRGLAVADRVLRWIERGATQLADAVITVHEPYRDELVARGVPREKTTVVMNTPDERLLPRRRDQMRSDGFRVAYHGTVTPHYGVHLLLEAAARVAAEIPRLRVEIYGEGDALPELRTRADALGIPGAVSFSDGYLPHHDVLDRVASATVGVIPNLPTRLNRFALSSKLFEYVALGVPVVSADLPTIRAHFTDDEIVFFRAGDAEALAAALLVVARDPAAASARAQAALRRYREYRWPVNAQRYAGVLGGSTS